jgi:uncharacterized Zn-binding protein involved in type VI secretion
MPRRSTKQGTLEAVYETVAAMLPPGDLCEQIWLPDLIRGLGFEQEPQTIWEAVRELVSAGLIELRYVGPKVKLAPEDQRLLVADYGVERMRAGYIRLAGGICSPSASAASPTITKILSVVDTREYEEVSDGKFKPIAGSGDSHVCDHCGREHEVHAHVLLSDGNVAVVGTTCMHGESATVTNAVKKATAAAKRLAALKAEQAANLARAEEFRRVEDAVALLPVPEPVEVLENDVRKLRMDDAVVWLVNGLPMQERHRLLVNEWRFNRETELGITWKHRQAAQYVKHYVDLVQKAEARLAGAVHKPIP